MVVSTPIRSAVQTATPAEASACLETLTRAFEDDPVCQWAWRGTGRYQEAFPRFCMAFGGAAFDLGTAQVAAGPSGVALWLPPGTPSNDDDVAELIGETTTAAVRRPLYDVFAQMGSQP